MPVRRGKLRAALEVSLKTLAPQQDADLATIELARLYADQLDADPTEARYLGPKYIVVLSTLGLTRRALNARSASRTASGSSRSAQSGVDGDDNDDEPDDELAKLRRRAAGRGPRRTTG